MAQEFVSAMGADTVTSKTLGRVLIVAEDWGFKVVFGIWLLFQGGQIGPP